MPDLWRPGDGQIRLCRARAAWAKGRARAGDDADRKVLANDKANVSTIIPTENPVGYFSMVKEITFPISMGMRPEDYKVFVAFERTQAGAG
jgi:hypothetical protein